jgi:hypothetical protein
VGPPLISQPTMNLESGGHGHGHLV